MCGRYVITSPPDAVRRLFGYEEQPNFPPRYNVAPTQPVPIVRLVDGKRHFALARWGLIPNWVKDPRGYSLLINARGESLMDKPAFRNAMRRRRCLFPADGFYEWKREANRRQPYFVRARQGGPIAYAGLWETWAGPNGEEVETAAIVTTSASSLIAHIHDRMPVIVPPEAFDLWLDCERVDATTASAVIAPAPDASIEVYAVGMGVNRADNDTPDLLKPDDPAAAPAEEPQPRRPARRCKRNEDDGQASLF